VAQEELATHCVALPSEGPEPPRFPDRPKSSKASTVPGAMFTPRAGDANARNADTTIIPNDLVDGILFVLGPLKKIEGRIETAASAVCIERLVSNKTPRRLGKAISACPEPTSDAKNTPQLTRTEHTKTSLKNIQLLAKATRALEQR